nr:uncharacterized protein LOC104119147 isoform X7 [Nicotiana tomentosiformis]
MGDLAIAFANVRPCSRWEGFGKASRSHVLSRVCVEELGSRSWLCFANARDLPHSRRRVEWAVYKFAKTGFGSFYLNSFMGVELGAILKSHFFIYHVFRVDGHQFEVLERRWSLLRNFRARYISDWSFGHKGTTIEGTLGVSFIP